ncbi:ATP-dependent helicase HrpB [Marinomonas sp. M1K-6]|uniref:ATP-dependent helicase HrpB n=1 Tax=Marinomonas profundi TaxID=2726122 RepID=A0A847RAK0_9GAMM|nr:ATP-dependent helicase HrpB [Marinomonas profundi]NLQ17984.1 ATP-dependent helicase HrpB [Marinomonas profundi]UDV01709.1 ATP-dependent helicase HrpB [Marinomonas profundi]
MSSELPIHALIPQLKHQLEHHHEAILEAAPGAGKTTVVPLALMAEAWLKGRKIIMLEPRRLAAKAAAKRLADTLHEPLGQRIGYRIRHEGKESQQTQVLVVTEGVLTRMLHDDPSLDDIALVIFDEFHERNLHSDLAFALCLQARELYRDEDPLKLLVMSATLDTEALETRLNCPTLTSQGRSFPITTHYSNQSLKSVQVTDEVVRLTCQAFYEETGSVLVFLPGQKEIRQAANQLQQRLGHETHLSILPLYGELSLKEQEAVIAPSPAPARKIVLATAIAQTSLTIEGIRVVVDSGLSREARFDANTATTRLHTRRATQAETIQRMGRAGRTEPGVCYRWWSEGQQHQLAPQAQPQIEISDLSSLVMDLAKWGVQKRLELDWITPPPNSHWQQAVDLLTNLQALEQSVTSPPSLALSELGEQMSRLGIEPRLARLLLEGKQNNNSETACAICTILSEGDPFSSHHSDLSDRLNWLAGRHQTQSKRPRQNYLKAQQQWQKRSLQINLQPSSTHGKQDIAFLLIRAFADRIAQRTGQDHDKARYKLANGRMASLSSLDPCAQSEWLIALDIGGHHGQEEDRIFLANPIQLSTLTGDFADLLSIKQHLAWSKKDARLISETQRWIGKLCIDKRKLSQPSEADVCQAVCRYIRQEGLSVLPWNDASEQLRARLQFAFMHDKQNTWPDCSDDALLKDLETWLGPYLGKTTNQHAMGKLPLNDILLSQLDWNQQQFLHRNVPTRLTAPSGSSHAIDYCEQQPTLRVKLQEMFGYTHSPSVLNQTIRIELLSPGQRPLAVTQDLAFFWREAYPEVRKEMRGRYPKHPWPEDPLNAQATAKTNRALRSS